MEFKEKKNLKEHNEFHELFAKIAFFRSRSKFIYLFFMFESEKPYKLISYLKGERRDIDSSMWIIVRLCVA